jgi:hypothetical protein
MSFLIDGKAERRVHEISGRDVGWMDRSLDNLVDV